MKQGSSVSASGAGQTGELRRHQGSSGAGPCWPQGGVVPCLCKGSGGVVG